MPLGNDGQWEAPDHWDDSEAEMFQDLVDANPQIADNDTVELYFHTAYFDTDTGLTQAELDVVRDELHDYLYEEYGIEWDDVFDWEAFREWYG